MIIMNITLPQWEWLISVDVETAGPNPSQYSLLSIGACSVFHPDQTLYLELKPVNLDFSPEALETCGLSLDKLSKEGVEPLEAMRQFETWLQKAVTTGQRPVFVGFNTSFDWMFVNDYFHRFLGHNPFGHAAIDIKSYYMGMANVPWEETTMRFLGQRYLKQTALIHQARQDALDQAEIFRKILLEAAGEQPVSKP
jgi:DNA polymerase III epsilon subunit-like protein